MRLDKIRLQNFRCFEDISLDFHESFNLIVGINGTGKTAILEALRIAIGSLFLEVDKYLECHLFLQEYQITHPYLCVLDC